MSESAAGIHETVHEIVRTTLERDIPADVDVFDHGASSLAFIRAVAAISDRYDIVLDVSELEEASVDALASLVAEQVGTTTASAVGA